MPSGDEELWTKSKDCRWVAELPIVPTRRPRVPRIRRKRERRGFGMGTVLASGIDQCTERVRAAHWLARSQACVSRVGRSSPRARNQGLAAPGNTGAMQERSARTHNVAPQPGNSLKP